MQHSKRTMILRGGLSYSVHNRHFIKNVPQEIDDDWIFFRLLQNPLFDESPPICHYHIQYNDQKKRVTRYEWLNLPDQKCWKIIPPLDVMDDFVAQGKEDFSLLITRNMGLGDIIICTDLLYNLRLRYPKAHIVFATYDRYKPVTQHLDFIDETVSFGLIDANDYDVAVNLCGWSEQRPQQSMYTRTDLYGMAFSDNFPWVEHGVHLQIVPEDQTWFYRFDALNNTKAQPIVVVQPFGSSEHRSIPEESAFALCNWLANEGCFVVVIGNDDRLGKWGNHPSIVVLNDIEIGQLFALIANSKFVVGPDSSAYHIAAAFNVSSLTIFTTIQPWARVSYYPKAHTAQICDNPCWDAPCKPLGDSPCVTGITADWLINRCEEVLQQCDLI